MGHADKAQSATYAMVKRSTLRCTRQLSEKIRSSGKNRFVGRCGFNCDFGRCFEERFGVVSKD